jgi:hypothetical protein
MVDKKISKAAKPITPVRGGYAPSNRKPVILADYETWCKADLWEVERGILLLLDLENLPHINHSEKELCEEYKNKFNKLWKVAESSLEMGLLKKRGKGYPQLFSEVLPIDFIQWAIDKEIITIPPRLQEWYEKQNKPIEQPREGINEQELIPSIFTLITQHNYAPVIRVYYYGKISMATTKDEKIHAEFLEKSARNSWAVKLSESDSEILETLGRVTVERVNFYYQDGDNTQGTHKRYWHVIERTTFTTADIIKDDIESNNQTDIEKSSTAKNQDDNKADSETELKAKPRKELKPLIREANEALLLIHALLKDKGVNYLDELPAANAWGLIVAQQFKDDSIATYPINARGEIVFNGGYKLGKTEFIKKYQSRFE